MTSRNPTSPFPRAQGGARDGFRLGDRAAVALFGAIGWPWLLKGLSGGRPEDKQALLAELDLPPDALPHLGGWKADVAFLQAIVAAVKTIIPWGFLLLIPALMAAGGSGFVLSRGRRAGLAGAKARRMPLIAANGILILIPVLG